MLITVARVRELLDYNPETGEFAWTKMGRVGGRAKNTKVGFKSALGYLMVGLDYKYYPLHRIAWLHACGRWPRGDIDHINLVKNDNRLDNLREATRSQNCANIRVHRDSSTGIKGVFWQAELGKYRARIRKNKRLLSLGCYDTKEEAAAAYAKAAKELFGEFALVQDNYVL